MKPLSYFIFYCFCKKFAYLFVKIPFSLKLTSIFKSFFCKIAMLINVGGGGNYRNLAQNNPNRNTATNYKKTNHLKPNGNKFNKTIDKNPSKNDESLYGNPSQNHDKNACKKLKNKLKAKFQNDRCCKNLSKLLDFYFAIYHVCTIILIYANILILLFQKILNFAKNATTYPPQIKDSKFLESSLNKHHCSNKRNLDSLFLVFILESSAIFRCVWNLRRKRSIVQKYIAESSHKLHKNYHIIESKKEISTTKCIETKECELDSMTGAEIFHINYFYKLLYLYKSLFFDKITFTSRLFWGSFFFLCFYICFFYSFLGLL